jgi:hypothetical protein
MDQQCRAVLHALDSGTRPVQALRLEGSSPEGDARRGEGWDDSKQTSRKRTRLHLLHLNTC